MTRSSQKHLDEHFNCSRVLDVFFQTSPIVMFGSLPVQFHETSVQLIRSVL